MKETIILLVIISILGYLLGSVNGAIVISRLVYKDDVRKYGSKNAGMTNMLRVYGKKAAIYTILVDFTKGMLAVIMARLAFAGQTLAFDPAYISAIFTIIGHIFPIYFKFKGGKGILAALGVITVLNPLVMLFMLLTFIPLCFVTKIVSLSSILGAFFYPIVTCLLKLYMGEPYLIDTILASVIAVMIIFMHRENIKRLLNGTERKFGEKKQDN